MRSKDTLAKIMNEVFVRMYEEASPPAEFPHQVRSYEDHYLSSDRQDQIMREVFRLRRLTLAERKQVSMAVNLGPCPNTQEVYSHKDNN